MGARAKISVSPHLWEYYEASYENELNSMGSLVPHKLSLEGPPRPRANGTTDNTHQNRFFDGHLALYFLWNVGTQR